MRDVESRLVGPDDVLEMRKALAALLRDAKSRLDAKRILERMHHDPNWVMAFGYVRDILGREYFKGASIVFATETTPTLMHHEWLKSDRYSALASRKTMYTLEERLAVASEEHACDWDEFHTCIFLRVEDEGRLIESPYALETADQRMKEGFRRREASRALKEELRELGNGGIPLLLVKDMKDVVFDAKRRAFANIGGSLGADRFRQAQNVEAGLMGFLSRYFTHAELKILLGDVQVSTNWSFRHPEDIARLAERLATEAEVGAATRDLPRVPPMVRRAF